MKTDARSARRGEVLKVGFILLPGFDLLAFTGFVETLRQAMDLGDVGRSAWTSWAVMAPDPAPVPASCGVSIIPGGTWRDPAEFNYLVVVGGRLSGVGASHRDLPGYLARAAGRKVGLVGLSSAVFTLAEAGLLKNRRCAIHWPYYQEFRSLYPEARPVIDEVFVEDRGIITCPGGSSAVDLARELMARFFGSERLVKIMRRMMIDWNRPSDRIRLPGLKNYMDIPDARVRRAVFFMTQNLSVTISTEDAAREAGLSLRQLERLFKETLDESPAEYLRALRLRQANWLVLNTRKTITDIAVECGFSDSSHFAKWYKDYFGLPPGRDRKVNGGELVEAIEVS